MKIASTIARYLLGLLFTVFGLNGFLNFIPATPMPPQATQFFTVLLASHYMVFVFVVQLAAGLLFLANRFVPLALTLIGPVIVNILLFHLSMEPGGIGPGAIATVCWFLVFYSVRGAFADIFQPVYPVRRS
jgi:putative oxidoreductase